MAVGVAVGEREVGGVVGHGVALGLYADARIGEREVAVGGACDGKALDGVALVAVGSHLEGVAQLHVVVERIVSRTGLLLGDAVVEGCADLRLVGEELTQFDIGRHAVGLEVVLRALGDALLQSTEALGEHAAGDVECAHVGELHVEVALCCPASAVVVLLQSEFVDPHLARLDFAREVAYAYHHGLHLAQRRIAHDGHLVLRTLLVVGREGCRIGGAALGTCHVAVFLQLGEGGERDVEHILLGPYQPAVLRVVVVLAGGGELQRYLILIVIALVVVAQAHEQGQLVVLQSGGVGLEGVGMGKHLQPAVLAQVLVGVLVDGLGLAVGETGHHHVEGLLVVLDELRLLGVEGTADAWRQHIVDGHLVGVLLDVHGADRHLARLAAAAQGLLVDAPLAAHQVEGAEAHDDGLGEVGEEHTHEAHAGEIVDAAHALLKVVDGDSELIPGDGRTGAIAQLAGDGALVDNEVAAHDQVLGAYAHMILVVALILVERVVLVDVLHIGCGLIRGVVALGAVFAVGRVTLWVVDELVALEDGQLHLVVVGAAEVVVVVVGGVVVDGVVDGWRHLALHLAEVLLVGAEGALFLIAQAIESHILQGA